MTPDQSAPPVQPDLKSPPATTVIARIRRLMPYFGTYPGTWLLVAVSAVVGAASEPLIPALLKPLLDRGFQQGTLEIWTVPVALILLFGVRGLAGYISQIGLSKITNRGLQNMRHAMFNKILVADLKLFSGQTSSALTNTLVYEVQTGAVMLVNSILSLVRNGLTLLALVGYLFYLNWKLTLIVAAIFPAVALVMRVLTGRVHRLTQASQEATDKLAYVVEENVLAHRDIRLYSAQQSQSERFSQLGEALRHLAMKSTVAGAAMTPMTQMLAAVALSAVISVALVQSASSGTSVGGFVAFVTAMLMIIAPIRQLSEVSSPITRGLVALERGLSLIEETPSEIEGNFSKPHAAGDICFQQVSVRYPSSSTLAIEDLDLNVMSGETVALVGSSGSGKTTLANLLPRFVDVCSGQVLLDGHDVRDWSLQALRSQIAFVSQSVVMLNDSILANVALGMESYGPHAQALQTREAVLRVTATHTRKGALELLSREIAPAGTSWAPGTTGAGSGRASVSPSIRQYAFLLSKTCLSARVELDGEPLTAGSAQASRIARDAGDKGDNAGSATQPMVDHPSAIDDGANTGDTIEVPLIRLAWARSGDKGDMSNIGVIARRPALLPLLRAWLTEARVAAFLAHLVKGRVTRYEVPGIDAFNFVCEQALDGGGMASLRNDPLGKGMAQILLSMPLRVPTSLLAGI